MNSASTSVLIFLVARLLTIVLAFANICIVPKAVASPLYRISLAALLISTVAGLNVTGIIIEYFTPGRDAIPWVEKLGMALIVITIAAGMLAIVTACIGFIRTKRAQHFRIMNASLKTNESSASTDPNLGHRDQPDQPDLRLGQRRIRYLIPVVALWLLFCINTAATFSGRIRDTLPSWLPTARVACVCYPCALLLVAVYHCRSTKPSYGRLWLGMIFATACFTFSAWMLAKLLYANADDSEKEIGQAFLMAGVVFSLFVGLMAFSAMVGIRYYNGP